MGRPSGDKNRCGARWTESKFNSFIRSLLRSGTKRWAPISDVLKAARTRRGFYLCAGCREEVPLTIKEGRRSRKNVFVDHIQPVINPEKGFEGWDAFVEKLFCEEDNLQVLCNECHSIKTQSEREAGNRRRRESE